VTLGQMHVVTIGQAQYNLRVIEKNPSNKGADLQVTDKVVISGLQRVRTGSTVEASLIPLPGGVSHSGVASGQSAPATDRKGAS